MLQELIESILEEDPALTLVAQCENADELPALWQDVDADVVVLHPLAADVPANALPSRPAKAPAVIGVDASGRRGIVVLDDLSRDGFRAAVHAAASLGHGGG
jgi:DNA-binding NarL/FixJ family response regulator